MRENPNAIPLEWMKNYVDKMLEMAKKFEPESAMRAALALRAEHAMDIVEAWKEERNA